MKEAALLMFLLIIACSKSGSKPYDDGQVNVSKTGAVTISDPQLMPVEQKFLSAGNPGKWDQQKSDHVPFVVVREIGQDSFQLEVSIGFNGDGAHYTENIILLNHRMQELQKADFKRGNKVATTRFQFTRKPEDKYFVISKCSMHDTWQAPVVLPKIKKDEE